MQKTCPSCKETKSTTEFHKHARRADGLQTECKPCKAKRDREYHEKNWDKIYTRRKQPVNVVRRLAIKYGVTDEEIISIRNVKDGLCEICKTREAVNIDHCHSTGKVRGFLCFHCNAGLGHFSDNKDWLQSAIDYLAR